jgi:hypothetical protein
VAILSGSVVACTGERQDRGITAASPADPAARRRVEQAAAPVDLPDPPLAGTPQFVANHGDDVVVFGSRRSDGAGLDLVDDDGAVLDAGAFAWSSLPGPPFRFATGDLHVAVSRDDLVVTGYACDPDSTPQGSSGPHCSVGADQTARLNLATGTWERIPNPPGPHPGYVVASLWGTPSGVLASVEVERGVPTWSRLLAGSRTWKPVAAPPVVGPSLPVTQVCGADGSVAVLATQTWSGPSGWSPTSMIGFGSGERYGRAVVTFWDDATGSWTTASEPAVLSGAASVSGGCVQGRYVLVVAGDGPTTGVASTDAGVWVLAAGSTRWERRPWVPPSPLFGAFSGPPWIPMPTVAHTSVVTSTVNLGEVWAYRVADDRWSRLADVSPYQLTNATVLGHVVATTDDSTTLRALPG